MSNPVITPSAPIVVNATYDSLWLADLHVSSPKVGGEANASIVLVPYTQATGVQAPMNMAIRIPVQNIFSQISAGNTTLEGIMVSVLAYAQTLVTPAPAPAATPSAAPTAS